MDNCIFCKIGHKEIPSYTIYEDDLCLAMLDISQTTRGHTLVIPKQHFKNILEVDSSVLSHMMEQVQKIALLLQEKLGATGFNVITNTNEIAGQSVFHFHIHIIPRYDENDTFSVHYTNNQEITDFSEIMAQIQK